MASVHDAQRVKGGLDIGYIYIYIYIIYIYIYLSYMHDIYIYIYHMYIYIYINIIQYVFTTYGLCGFLSVAAGSFFLD